MDFGTKGGELDKKSRRPVKLDFYTISEEVGKAADKVFENVDLLSTFNPTPNATAYFPSPSLLSPLHGKWNLLFTTAADASFSSNTTRGSAKPSNIVDSVRGKITNIIQFPKNQDGTTKLVDKLRVSISVRTSGLSRFLLTFRYACIHFNRFFYLPLKWRLYIPVPGPFFTRIIFSLMGRRKDIPRPYFDVVYLDETLRIHRTGEGNLFVQAKEGWREGEDLIGT